MIVRSNMCRGFPQAVRMDYSELGVCDGPLDRLADPVDVPGTRPGKDGSPAGGSLLTGAPGSRCPVERAPGSRRVRRSWPESPAALGEPPGGGIVEGGCEQGRRDDDAPGRRGSPTDGAPDPGPRPDSPGADAQTDGATGATDTTGPGLAPAARPRRPPLVGDGADKPSFGAFPRLSARSYRECHQLMDRTGRRFP